MVPLTRAQRAQGNSAVVFTVSSDVQWRNKLGCFRMCISSSPPYRMSSSPVEKLREAMPNSPGMPPAKKGSGGSAAPRGERAESGSAGVCWCGGRGDVGGDTNAPGGTTAGCVSRTNDDSLGSDDSTLRDRPTADDGPTWLLCAGATSRDQSLGPRRGSGMLGALLLSMCMWG